MERSPAGQSQNDRLNHHSTPRCPWCGEDPLYREYHDTEWGQPCFDDQKLFEFLILEGAQAGLSWITILRKRDNYRRAFDQFDAEKIARYGDSKVRQLKGNAGIVRNELKIRSAINNAQRYLELCETEGSFSDYLWKHVDGVPVLNRFKHMREVPASTALSDRISKDMKKRGFKFFGTTICYAHLQAMGLVNDHLTSCHCHPDNR